MGKMPNENHDPFVVGEFLVEPRLNRVSRADEHIAVRPKSMDLLVLLASRNGDVVESDEIIDEVWNGNFVTSNAIYNCIIELRQAFSEDKAEPRYIETIPKRGYRLIAEVCAVDQDPETRPDSGPENTSNANRWPIFMWVAAVVLLAMFTFMFWPRPVIEPEVAAAESSIEKPSIAVMPFANLTNDPDYEYLASGLPEELITALSQLDDIWVVGRSSSFYFRDRPESPREIGEALDVAYLLEGSIRVKDKEVRVSAHLVTAADGVQIWSDSYDKQLTDTFDLQDAITAAIMRALKRELPLSSPQNVKHQPDPEAFQHYLRGRHYWNLHLPGAAPKAIEQFERAIELDPNFAEAYAGLGDSYITNLNTMPRAWVPRHLAEASKASAKSIELDPNHGVAYATRSYVNLIERNFEAALADVARANELSPEHAVGYHWHATWLQIFGNALEAEAVLKRALAVDPMSRPNALSYGVYLLRRGRTDEGLELIDHALMLDPRHPNAWVVKYVVMLHLGRFDEALAPGLEFARLTNADPDAIRGWIDVIKSRGVSDHASPRSEMLTIRGRPYDTVNIRLLTIAGFHEEAIDLFEEVTADGYYLLIGIRPAHPYYLKPLYAYPRFRAALTRLGFTEYWRKHGFPEGCAATSDMDFECEWTKLPSNLKDQAL